jgi:restriction endonuclease S subunit
MGDFDFEAQVSIATQFELVEQLKIEICQKRTLIKNVSIDIDLSEYSIVYKPLSEVLTPIKGKSIYTRKYGNVHQGEYPVFSASSASPLTYIDTFDFDGSYLSWSTNGFAGTVMILDGRFSINGDRGILVPKIENIDILYLRYALEPAFRQLAKGRKGDHGEDEFTKLYPSMISHVNIPFPIDENGSISLTAQQEIAAIYDSVEHFRSEVLEKLDAILELQIAY